jgi:hypothetical protein
VWTLDPLPLSSALTSLRFSLLKQGSDIDAFHAAEDRQVVRDSFVKTIGQHESWKFAAIVIEKRKLFPRLREPGEFYPKFLTSVLRFVIRGRLSGETG